MVVITTVTNIKITFSDKNMILNTFDRGVLENLFEVSIRDMEVNVDVAREKMFHVVLNDKDGVDLALGIALGTIHTAFIAGFRQRNGRKMTSEEKDELWKITETKLGQLREAIFQCG